MHSWRILLDTSAVARAVSTFALATVLIVDSSTSLPAQSTADSARAARRDTIASAGTVALPPQKIRDDSKELVPLFGWRDAVVGASFVAGTIVLFQVDKVVAERTQDKVTQANAFLKDFSKPSELLAWPGGLVIETGFYTFGRLTHHKRAAEVGWHGMEAMLLAAGVTNVLKSAVGRARPYVSADTNAHDFKFLGGFGNDSRTSFPSGHTSTAFAFASAVASESRTKWPHQWWSAWLIGPALYGGATVVGLSRMYHNKHWASDVALGAAIGTFSGIKVVQYAHEHPTNLFDRIMLHTSVVPNGNGKVALAWNIPTR